MLDLIKNYNIILIKNLNHLQNNKNRTLNIHGASYVLNLECPPSQAKNKTEESCLIPFRFSSADKGDQIMKKYVFCFVTKAQVHRVL